MNMHIGSLPPPLPPAPRKPPPPQRFACCPFCGHYALRFTVDRTSVECQSFADNRRCGTIMPGEWFA